jgi:hypothetical protein
MQTLQENIWTIVVIYWDRVEIKSRQIENENSYKI